MTLESAFQRKLIHEIQNMYPGAIILKTDPNYIQGIPDWLILNGPRWASFEAKNSLNSPHQPNQDWYVAKMNQMSFSRFVYPENRRAVLHELQRAFRST